MIDFPFKLDTINAVDKIGVPVVVEPGTPRLQSEYVNIIYVILRTFSTRTTMYTRSYTITSTQKITLENLYDNMWHGPWAPFFLLMHIETNPSEFNL